MSLLSFRSSWGSRILVQYVKQETIINTEHGREARAIRLITERASERIGRMAFDLALTRPRKVGFPFVTLTTVLVLTDPRPI